jgi:hypothetical protein
MTSRAAWQPVRASTGNGQRKARGKAEAASDDPTLRQSYLDLAAAYDKLADTLDRSPPADPAGVPCSTPASNGACVAACAGR